MLQKATIIQNRYTKIAFWLYSLFISYDNLDPPVWDKPH